MVDGVVVDTNIIENFYKEYVLEEGDILILINNILENCGIAITELIEAEWSRRCNDQLFSVWFTDNLRDGNIRYVMPEIDRHILKRIHNEFGLPRRGVDKELIKASNVTIIKYILTNDIDLFDPKKKKAQKKEKERIKDHLTGMRSSPRKSFSTKLKGAIRFIKSVKIFKLIKEFRKKKKAALNLKEKSELSNMNNNDG